MRSCCHILIWGSSEEDLCAMCWITVGIKGDVSSNPLTSHPSPESDCVLIEHCLHRWLLANDDRFSFGSYKNVPFNLPKHVWFVCIMWSWVWTQRKANTKTSIRFYFIELVLQKFLWSILTKSNLLDQVSIKCLIAEWASLSSLMKLCVGKGPSICVSFESLNSPKSKRNVFMLIIQCCLKNLVIFLTLAKIPAFLLNVHCRYTFPTIDFCSSSFKVGFWQENNLMIQL